MVFGEYGNYCLLFFDITLNFLKKNMYANLLTRCDDACIITPYLFIYIYGSYTPIVLKLVDEATCLDDSKYIVNIEPLKV